jgi:hypothetical protein
MSLNANKKIKCPKKKKLITQKYPYIYIYKRRRRRRRDVRRTTPMHSSTPESDGGG